MKDKQCRCTMHRFVKYTAQTLGYLTTASKWRRCKEMSLNKKTAGHKTSQTSHQVRVFMVMMEVVIAVFRIQPRLLLKFFKCYSVQSGSPQQEPFTFHSTHHVRRSTFKPSKRLCDLYRMMQEEWSIFWEFIASITVRKKIHMDMCLILNGYRDTAVWI